MLFDKKGNAFSGILLDFFVNPPNTITSPFFALISLIILL
nr:MAG TPA: hypothetical protein [Inoviridae sp.]